MKRKYFFANFLRFSWKYFTSIFSIRWIYSTYVSLSFERRNLDVYYNENWRTGITDFSVNIHGIQHNSTTRCTITVSCWGQENCWQKLNISTPSWIIMYIMLVCKLLAYLQNTRRRKRRGNVKDRGK